MSNVAVQVGHNNPPGPIELVPQVVASMSEFLAGAPVIETEDQSRAAGVHQRSAELLLKDLEADRTKTVKPLNDEVKAINATYKAAVAPLDAVLQEMKKRNAAFHRRAEEERQRIADEKRRALEEAERAAREAAAKADEALDNAACGEVGVEVGDAVTDAIAKAGELKRAERDASRAEKDRFRTMGGDGRVVSLRTKETIVVHDWRAALDEMGASQAVIDAIATEARKWRSIYGDLPAGVVSQKERVL